MGVPLVDGIAGLSLDVDPDERVDQAVSALEALPAGLTHFVFHPSKDTPELRAITPDWPCRVADYQAFSSPRLKEKIRQMGVQVIGYRALKELMPVQ